MEFAWNPTQQLLKQTARELLGATCDLPTVRRIAETPGRWDPGLWAGLAETGFLGLLVPEEWGGSGGTTVDLAAVLEEVGRALLPGPFLETALVAAALARGGSRAQQERWLPRLAAGELVATVAWLEDAGAYDPAALRTQATGGPDGYRLDGRKCLVPYGDRAGLLLCPARGPDGVGLYLVEAEAEAAEALTAGAEPTLDLTCQLATVTLAAAPAEPLGEPGAGEALLQRVWALAAAGLAAEMTGGAERALELAVDYARERVQFDRPIGSFQAIKHRCADMLMLTENARSAAQYAAWALAADEPGAEVACAVAKAYAGEAYLKTVAGAIQVHGGIGFTWEHPLHLYYRRAHRCAVQYGDANYHYAALAQQLAGDAGVQVPRATSPDRAAN